MSLFWVDVDNPPQAQFMSSIVQALRMRGHEITLTARNDAATLGVLANRGESAIPVTGNFGPSKAAKFLGTIRRALLLAFLVFRQPHKPVALISTARSAVIAASLLRIPSFSILDYEGVELGTFRWFGATVLHPSAVPTERFTERGFPPDRLHDFPGIKEDITFFGLQDPRSFIEKIPQPRLEHLPAILIRPPSETSHYRVDESMDILRDVLLSLSRRSDLQVIFVPRRKNQIRLIDELRWKVPVVVLNKPLAAERLYPLIDSVVTGGGTMLREAAWFGIPGFSIFRGDWPAVDEYLEAKGLIRRLSPDADLSQINWLSTKDRKRLERHPEALDQVIDLVLTTTTA